MQYIMCKRLGSVQYAFFNEVNTFIQKAWIQFIESDIKDISWKIR